MKTFVGHSDSNFLGVEAASGKSEWLCLQMLIHRYNSEEWENVIAKDPDWTREETDYLLDLCSQFCLKFHAIADRYEVLAGLPFTVTVMQI